LAAREEEVARQNEALQSQAEELERQGEELRVANEELADRQRALEVMLALSRALTTEHSRHEMMVRVCDTVAKLIDGPTVASAILEHEGERMVVRCHDGFGPDGPAEDAVPVGESFASLVMSRGRTAYLEDLSQRPDLKVPQPKTGDPLVSILAAPLRADGWPVGTLEVYSRRPGPWSDEHVALVDSLAAQASVSLEAASLFERVEQERTRYETVLRTVPFGIAVCDAEYADVRLNPAGAAMFGVPPDTNLQGDQTTHGWAVYRDGKPLAMESYPLYRAAREGLDVYGSELELVMPSGRRVTILTHASPIRDREGKARGAVAAFVDITPLKELQRELDTKRREAEEASVRKTRFLAAVSHDIRTPANAINLLAELIRRASVNPAMAAEVPDMARELQASALSLVELLTDVLDVARYDSGRVDMNETEFSLGELMAEEHRRMAPLAREKGLSLRLNAPDPPVWVRADRIKLSRVIGNLLGNAIKFTDRGEVRLEAGLRDDDGSAEVRVADTGIGIAPEYQQSIFDEFVQLRNPERDRTKGAGLGLTICKRLVDAMGGGLSVRSEAGRGSTFAVTLPASAVVAAPIAV
jgi:PAS domain S-box-containing protein